MPRRVAHDLERQHDRISGGRRRDRPPRLERRRDPHTPFGARPVTGILLAALLWSVDLAGCPRPVTAMTAGALEPPCTAVARSGTHDSGRASVPSGANGAPVGSAQVREEIAPSRAFGDSASSLGPEGTIARRQRL